MFHQRPPQWIVTGAALLACIAGWINAIGLLGMFHEAITHVTGTLSRGALDLVLGQPLQALRAVVVVASFGAGSVAAGVLVTAPEATRGRRYTAALLLEAGLLAIAWALLANGLPVGENVAAAAAGLQNGLVTTWSGAIIRTTHVTGLVTDVGLAIGHRLRGAEEPARAGLRLAIIVGFFLGGALGAVAWRAAEYAAFAGPVVLCTFAAAAYQLTSPTRKRP